MACDGGQDGPGALPVQTIRYDGFVEKFVGDAVMAVFGVLVPKPSVTPELMEAFASTRINHHGDLPEPLPVLGAAAATARMDIDVKTTTDEAEMDRQ